MRKGWKIIGFEDCLDKIVYTKKIQRKDFLQSGNFPIISQEQDFINGYWNESVDLLKIKKPVIIFGDHTQVLKYVPFDFVLGADGVKILQPKDEFVPKYFYYFLTHVDLKKLGYARHYRLLKEILVPLPPLLEQQHIITILDESFAAIAKAKENVGKNLANAREVFESYLQSVFANPGEGWEEKRIEQIAKVVNGFSFDSADFAPTNKLKSIKITNVGVKEFVEENDNLLPEQFGDTYKSYKVQEGNIVIALTRTIISGGLKVAVVPKNYNSALLNQRVAALIPLPNMVNKRFLYNYLGTDIVMKYVKSHVNTLMQPNLSITDLKNLTVPLPKSISEQRSIVAKLDGLATETHKLATIYKQKLADLEELKKSILEKAFAGEL